MEKQELQAGIERLKSMIEPWHQALAAPESAQQAVLERLLGYYSQTVYGSEHQANRLSSGADFKAMFPVRTYQDFKPLIDRVMAGETTLLRLPLMPCP